MSSRPKMVSQVEVGGSGFDCVTLRSAEAASDGSAASVRPGSGVATLPLRMLSPRWRLATLLVLIGMALTARLGIWQLDRLEQRREFNSRVLAQMKQPALELSGAALRSELSEMEYRSVVVRGVYDHSQEVALRNQAWGNQWGVHLLTPLRIEASEQHILVDRGWVPSEDFQYGSWEQYAEPGLVEVRGVIRRSQSKPDFGRRTDPIPSTGERLEAWFFANVEGIARQTPYPLLPAYIQQAPDPSWDGLPYRTQPDLELSEGPHLSYALQWFSFAAILGIGYPFFIRRQERRYLQAA
ncbi:MAG TPA: SURF1 family protein [Anaerolineales bacterium]|nr:SURF1 family protein [Anaerolineales bacterium]